MWPSLNATPDFLCQCDCSGQGFGEVKCPYCIYGIDFDSYVQKKNGSVLSSRRDHDYYYYQRQIHTSGGSTADGVCVFCICFVLYIVFVPTYTRKNFASSEYTKAAGCLSYV